MQTQIPMYRAKKIDSDEYVEGFFTILKPDDGENRIENMIYSTNLTRDIDIMHMVGLEAHKIDPSTLAIHFPNMLDSKGTRIFASLSEDGKGGDMIELSNYVQWSDEKTTQTAKYDHGLKSCFYHEGFKPKVIGIQ